MKDQRTEVGSQYKPAMSRDRLATSFGVWLRLGQLRPLGLSGDEPVEWIETVVGSYLLRKLCGEDVDPLDCWSFREKLSGFCH